MGLKDAENPIYQGLVWQNVLFILLQRSVIKASNYALGDSFFIQMFHMSSMTGADIIYDANLLKLYWLSLKDSQANII